jgi:hypothetical protein
MMREMTLGARLGFTLPMLSLERLSVNEFKDMHQQWSSR